MFINALSNSLTSTSHNKKTYHNYNIYDVILPKFVALIHAVLDDFLQSASIFRVFLKFIKDLKLTLTDGNEEDVQTKAFIEDLYIDCVDSGDANTGQVVKASSSDFFDKWGKHYLLSIASAFEKRVCTNFKDKAMQNFKSEQFSLEQKRVEDVFIDLPPPKPTGTFYDNSGRITSAPVVTSMAGKKYMYLYICKKMLVFFNGYSYLFIRICV